MAFSSGQNGGGGSVIDKALGGESLARPWVDCREDRERNTHTNTNVSIQTASSKLNDGWSKSPISPSPRFRRLALRTERPG